MFPRRGHRNGFYHTFSQDSEPYPDYSYEEHDVSPWAPQDHPQPGWWDNPRSRHEEGFQGGWHSPFSRESEPYPADFYGGDEASSWPPEDHPQPGRWDSLPRRHEKGFRDGWYSARPSNHHCPESESREERGHSWDRQRGYFPSKYRGHSWRHHRSPFRGSYQGKFAPRYHQFQHSSSRENVKPRSSHSPESHSVSSRKRSDSSKAEKSAAHKKPGKSKKDSAAPGRDPNPPQIQPEASQKAPDPPSQAGSALDTAPPTLFKTTEPLCPVRMEGTGLLPSCRGTPPLCRKAPQIQQEATENHSQDCCTPEADSVLAETSKDHCVPKEEIKLLHPQVLLEASHKTTDHSSQAGSTLAAELSAPPGTTEEPHPIRTEEAELEQLDTCQEDSGYPYQACSAQSTPSETLEDPRSAAILARKEEIEQSYQQYSLAFAVVATLLLQKEPSMEAAMGSALRANLRQVGGHCLRQLEHFICSYDAGASHS
ncbi:uncharacterized protein LOC142001902 isoform X2 [Carettochelys insculpta]|uniref:uncharacterized protein LOC142001902 isoform X2 n=1 Tax=Carettochelys insculpta TaxID=44489 RepID=UPI003EBD1B80